MRWNEIFESNLTELFDTGVADYQWDQKNDEGWRGTFEVDGTQYNFDAWQWKKDTWEIEFSDRSQPTMRAQWSNTNNKGEKSIEVFGTVMAMIKDFLQGAKPPAVDFTAAEDQNRVGLYSKLVQRGASGLSQLGYDVEADQRPGRVIFKFVRKPVN